MKDTLRKRFNYYKANNPGGLKENMMINTVTGTLILLLPRIIVLPIIIASFSKFIIKSKMSKPCWSDSYVHTNGQDFIYDYQSLIRLNRVDFSKPRHVEAFEFSKTSHSGPKYTKKRLSQNFVSALSKSRQLSQKLQGEMNSASENRKKIEKRAAVPLRLFKRLRG